MLLQHNLAHPVSYTNIVQVTQIAAIVSYFYLLSLHTMIRVTFLWYKLEARCTKLVQGVSHPIFLTHSVQSPRLLAISEALAPFLTQSFFMCRSLCLEHFPALVTHWLSPPSSLSLNDTSSGRPHHHCTLLIPLLVLTTRWDCIWFSFFIYLFIHEILSSVGSPSALNKYVLNRAMTE